jgi:hypothetical protein
MVREILRDIARVSRRRAAVRVQMANIFGLHQLSNQASARWLARFLTRTSHPSYGFRVRALTSGKLLRTLSNLVGPSNLTADGFFSLDARPPDVDLLKPLSAPIVRVSEHLTGAGRSHRAAGASRRQRLDSVAGGNDAGTRLMMSGCCPASTTA